MATMATPTIHTYHCACTSLLLATTSALPSLPRRAASLDRAIILPLSSETHPASASTPHTTLLSMTPDRRTTVIRREDGFEKRTLWRCGRCRVVVGYELDPAHFEGGGRTGGMDVGNVDGEGGEGEEERGTLKGGGEGRRVLYILPGWLQSTEHMASGKKILEGDAALEGAKLGIAAWE